MQLIADRSKREASEEEKNQLFSKKTVEGGIFGDRDSRTRHGLRTMAVTIIAFIFIASGLVMSVVKFGEYQDYLRYNTTPVGTVLQFARSDADITISDVWTDQQKDVTVVKLAYSKNARTKLSNKGANYKLYIMGSKLSDKPKDVKMSYGMLSTDGDAFLIIDGKLEEKAYQIFITNQLKMAAVTPESNTGNKITLGEDDSITEALSRYSMAEIDQKGIAIFNKDKQERNDVDHINFRVNPYSLSTNIYQGSFLNEKGEVDYSKIVSITSTKGVIEKLETQRNSSESNIRNIEASITEFRTRLEQNPDDQTSVESINELTKKLDSEKQIVAETNKALEMYNNADFNKDSFGQIQEEYTYVASNN